MRFPQHYSRSAIYLSLTGMRHAPYTHRAIDPSFGKFIILVALIAICVTPRFPIGSRLHAKIGCLNLSDVDPARQVTVVLRISKNQINTKSNLPISKSFQFRD